MDNEKNINRIKKRLAKCFVYILILPTVLWLFLCAAGLLFPGIMSAIDFDLGENRNDAAFPKTFSNDYFAKLEDYYEDKAPFRSVLINLNSQLSYALEKPYEDNIKSELIAYFHPAKEDKGNQSGSGEAVAEETTKDFSDIFDDYTAPTTVYETQTNEAGEIVTEPYSHEEETTVYYPPIAENVYSVIGNIDTTTYLPAVVKNDFTILGRGDWLFLYAGGNMDYYLGTNILDDATMNNYMLTMDTLDNMCKLKGKEVVFLTAPSKAQVYSEYMPSYEVETTYKRTQRLCDYVNANSDVKMLYPIDILTAIKPYYLSYMKYDSHWNDIGAFLAYQTILGKLNMPTTNLLMLNVTPSVLGGGDLIATGKLNASDYVNDRSYSIDYKSDVTYTLEGNITDDTIVLHYTSDASDNRKVCVVGDSYRHHIKNYFYRDFSDVSVAHVNTLGVLPQTDTAISEADIIVIVLVERNDSLLPFISNYICTLLNK